MKDFLLKIGGLTMHFGYGFYILNNFYNAVTMGDFSNFLNNCGILFYFTASTILLVAYMFKGGDKN